MVSRNYLVILLIQMNILGSVVLVFIQIIKIKINIWTFYAKMVILTFSSYLKCVFSETNFILGE